VLSGSKHNIVRKFVRKHDDDEMELGASVPKACCIRHWHIQNGWIHFGYSITILTPLQLMDSGETNYLALQAVSEYRSSGTAKVFILSLRRASLIITGRKTAWH
jgi:hypothetical protein